LAEFLAETLNAPPQAFLEAGSENAKSHSKMVADAPISAATVETFSWRIADRRKRQRVAVQWPLRLWRTHEHILDTCTVNVSSGGFYCVCSQPLSPGEALIAVLEIPACGTDGESQKLVLRCEVLVLRVERVIDSCNCGVACRIINYSVVRPESMEAEQKTGRCCGIVNSQLQQNDVLSERS
jgi:hypothetical protein